MAINDWPELERPREKMLKRGASALSDAELLAIFLRTGYAGASAVDLARELLNYFGSLPALLAADAECVCARPGMGLAKYIHLQVALEVSSRHMGEKLQRGVKLGGSKMVCNYLMSRLRHHQREVFAILLLDNQMRIILFEELFWGDLDSARVYPREVIKKALQHNAAAVIAAHNHPGGRAQASQADERLTRILFDALALVDIRLLDHMIVADNEVVSLAELGLL